MMPTDSEKQRRWKEQIRKEERRIYTSLVDKVLENYKFGVFVKPFSSWLGDNLVEVLFRVYGKAYLKLEHKLSVYLLENKNLIKKNKLEYELTSEGEAVFKDYFTNVFFKQIKGPNWDEKVNTSNK